MANFWQRLPKQFSVLAPMEDVTDYVFREIVATKFPPPDVFFTEFTNTDALVSKGREDALTNFRFSEKQRPIVAQIWGINPENFFAAAKIVKDLKFDGVDINMGCPVRAITKKGAGASLIKSPSLAAEIIASVKEGAEGLPLSVKTRVGYDKVETEEWIGFLLKQKLSALTVHGRIASEMSTKPADWEEIGKAVKLKNTIAPETVIVGNGDVESYQNAISLCEKHGVDGVMIARGIFKNPYVFQKSVDVVSPDDKELISILLSHAKLFSETWGDTKNFEALKKFFKMYIKGFSGANALRIELMKTHNYEEVLRVINKSIREGE